MEAASVCWQMINRPSKHVIWLRRQYVLQWRMQKCNINNCQMVRRRIVFNRCYVTWQLSFATPEEAEAMIRIHLLLRLKLNTHQTNKKLFVY